MSVKLNDSVMPIGITLLGISLVIYKLLGGTATAADFISGMFAGMAVVLIGVYLFIAYETGEPIDSHE